MATPKLAAPINPLAGDLEPIRVYSTVSKSLVDTEGKVVTPGLAISSANDSVPARFNLTHLGSGLAAVHRRCGQHILDAAQLAVESGIDWTIPDKNTITAAIKPTTFAVDLRERTGWMCDDHCVGDGPKPPAWSVSCSTCHWVSEDDDSPLSVADAKRMADDHECEPEMSIRNPATGVWHATWLVNDDGTVRDVSPKRAVAVAP